MGLTLNHTGEVLYKYAINLRSVAVFFFLFFFHMKDQISNGVNAF